ncbi:hypothetical protein ACTXT7_009644 [Hymenolepis weldensis]
MPLTPLRMSNTPLVHPTHSSDLRLTFIPSPPTSYFLSFLPSFLLSRPSNAVRYTSIPNQLLVF